MYTVVNFFFLSLSCSGKKGGKIYSVEQANEHKKINFAQCKIKKLLKTQPNSRKYERVIQSNLRQGHLNKRKNLEFQMLAAMYHKGDPGQ